jgi:predicted DNA-binding transcriptional regulator YafY
VPPSLVGLVALQPGEQHGDEVRVVVHGGDATGACGQLLSAWNGIIDPMLGTSARLLRLLSLLQTHRDWTGPELALRLEVSARTVRRDVDRLRELGYPVDAAPGVAGGYRLGAGAELPPLLLDDEEAVAVAVGLRTAAGGTVAGIEETSVRALLKLEQVLPNHLRRRVAALHAHTVPLLGRLATVDADTLTVIAGACRDHERLRFAYSSRVGDDTRRLVEPHGLVSTGRRWYLLAWDCGREDWRTFRVDRIAACPTTDRRFDPRPPPDPDVAAYVGRAISTNQFRHTARVLLHCPAAQIADWVGPAFGTIVEIDDESCELRTGADHLEQIAVWAAMLRVEFAVIEPVELKDALRSVAQRLERAAAR